MKGWNLIGFNFPNYSMIDPSRWKHCVVHPGSKLISKPNEPGTLFCPLCGTPHRIEDVAKDENFEPAYIPGTKTKIFRPKTKKKYYNKQGNEINVEQVLKDLANGKTIVSYHEYKTEGDSTKPKRIVRRKSKE